MNTKILKIFTIGMSALSLAACNDFLDEMPDNRATLDSEDKISHMLVSAYMTNLPTLVMEYMSDNVDDNGSNNPYTNRFFDQVYRWEDITEGNNESPESFYDAAYKAIASANAALQAIEDLGGATTPQLQAAKGEALLCRAYNHFMLVNYFCMAYNSETSTSDLGMPYSTSPETELRPEYERGTVAEDYARMEADIVEGLPLINDQYYSVPKYHFNQKAAYAFASRFYLYYEKWDKCIEYADKCLGDNPASQLRDYSALASMVQDYEAVGNAYIDGQANCNLLLLTGYSVLGLAFGPYYSYGKYSHGSYMASNEDSYATNVWGSPLLEKYQVKSYGGTNLNKYIYWRYPRKFEYTDPVAGIGFNRTVAPVLTTDEVLLNRAEAKAVLKQYDASVADLNIWMKNFTNVTTDLTLESIKTFYNGIDYCYSDDAGLNSTQKKHINPHFSIDAEGSDQESLLQCVLGFKRLETLQCGLRWFDLKRYRIVYPRRLLASNGTPQEKTDELKTDDPRRAIQLPKKVIDAGLEKNPR